MSCLWVPNRHVRGVHRVRGACAGEGGRGVKWAARIAVLLLIGAALNVAVAWGCALWSPAGTRPRQATTDWICSRTDSEVVVHTQVNGLDPGTMVTEYSYRRGVGVVLAWIRIDEYVDDVGKPGREVRVVRAGWPFSALGCEGRLDRAMLEQPAPGAPERWVGGLATPEWLAPQVHSRSSRFAAYRRPVPLRPEWPGFALNTLLYAALGFCAAWGAMALRTVRRRWHRVRAAGTGT